MRSDRGSMPLGWEDTNEEPKFDKAVYAIGKNSKFILFVGTVMFLSALYLVTFVMPKVFP